MKIAKRGSYWLLGLLLTVGGVTSATAQVSFTEVADSVGLGGETFRGSTGHALGACWIDYNDDGWSDLFVVNGFDEGPAHLYRNDIDGSSTFTKVDELLPVMPQVEMMGCIFGDYDNDGDDDIYIFTDNEVLLLHDPNNPPDGPANIFLHNMWVENGGTTVPGEPLFVDVAAAAGVDDLANPAWDPNGYPGYRSTSGGFFDYDRDGFIDLYVVHWRTEWSLVEMEATNKDYLYRNNGDGTFSNVTDVSGMNDGITQPNMNRPGLAAIAAHLDQDLWPDVYVVNVHDDDPGHNDFFYQNNGDGTFTEAAQEGLGASPGLGTHDGAGMGIDVADVENDGDWDFYISDIVTNIIDSSNGNAFHTSNGDGTFADNSAVAAGIYGVTSWGVNFFDADLDGFEDLFVGGAGPDDGNVMYHNNGTNPPTFTDISGTAFDVLYDPHGVRGATTADYDNDGDIDLLLVNQAVDNKLHLMRNNYIENAGANNWLKVRVAPTNSNGTGIGALVKIRTAPGEPVMRRQIIAGVSTHSQDEMVAHFGVGSAEQILRVQVVWPNGGFSEQFDVDVNQTITFDEADAATALFTDVTATAGVEYEHGYTGGINGPPRRIAGGVAAGDFNNDSLPDLYIERGDIGPNVLLKNDGDGTFSEVTATGGIDLPLHKGSGPTFGDINGDGLLDLFVGATDGDAPKLFLNNGDETFSEIANAGGIDHGDRNTFSAALADYNEDGFLDFALAHWDTGDNPCEAPCTGHLWANNGNLTFTDDDIAAGITGYPDNAGNDRTFAPNFADWTGDGKLDLLMVGDFGTSQVFANDGDGTFTNVTDDLVITDQNGMGTAVGDYDNDLDLDWFVSSILDPQDPIAKSGNRLYRNMGSGTGLFDFEDATDEAGVRDGSWGWGGCFADFNNDRNLDLFHTNGWAGLPWDTDESRLFMNAGDGTFSEMAGLSLLVDTGEGRGIVCFDYDRDGDIDVFVARNSDFTKLYRNDGANGNFLNISLRSRTKNVYGIGAKIYVTAAGETQMREMRAGSNFASQNPAEEHFGLGNVAIASDIQVNWPDGVINHYDAANANQFLELKQVYDSVGLYRPDRGLFYLKHTNSGGKANIRVRYASRDMLPVVGDWNGDGIDTIGVYDPLTGAVNLRDSNDRTGTTLFSYTFEGGSADFVPIAGDWNGDGIDTIGVFHKTLMEFRLRNDHSTGAPDITFTVTPVGTGWQPIAGDWDDDGVDTTGIYLADTSEFELKNTNAAGAPDVTFLFGPTAAGLKPMAGSWNGHGGDGVGVYDSASASFLLKNDNSAGAADFAFQLGPIQPWFPITGVWN